MGAIWIILTLLFSCLMVSGQTPLAKKAFDEATLLANAGQFEKALQGYRTAANVAELGPGEFAVKIHYNLGVCYYRTGKLGAAVKEFNTAIKLSSNRHQRAFYALGMTQSAQENWPAARASFLRAIEFRPADGEAWFDLAFVYLAERDYESAAAAFRKSIENRSVDAAISHNNIGVIMAVKHRFAEAEKAFAAALNLSQGRLTAASDNLKFCRSLRAGSQQLLAAVHMRFSARNAARLGMQVTVPG